ncbi:MAG: isochorismatase family protein [Planctomycetota bacterium]|jgi:ureidoacrylate peracid hydrolase
MSGPQEFSEMYVTAETLDAELAKWLKEIGPYQWRKIEKLHKETAALLVVDMTRPFVDGDGALASANAQAIVGRTAELINAFRATARPVVWLVQGHHSVEHDRGKHLSNWWPRPILEGTSDVEIAAGLEVTAGEKVIIKRRYSGFYQTDLECTLRCLEVKQLVICGVLTNVCPYITAFDAFFRDFCVYYPADCTASLNRQLHIAALRSIAGWCGYVVGAGDIIKWLGQ